MPYTIQYITVLPPKVIHVSWKIKGFFINHFSIGWVIIWEEKICIFVIFTHIDIIVSALWDILRPGWYDLQYLWIIRNMFNGRKYCIRPSDRGQGQINVTSWQGNSHHFTFLKFENPSSGSKVTDISITGVKYPHILIWFWLIFKH